MDSDLYEDDIDINVDDDIAGADIAADTDDNEITAADVEDDGEDDGEYSKKVQKRISKVVQQRNIERDKRTHVEQENAQLREKLAKFDAANKDAEIALLRKQKIDALEIGDYDAYADIDDKLYDIKSSPVERVTQQQVEKEAPSETPDELVAWQEKNKWIFEPDNPKVKKANDIFFALLDVGYEKDDPELYKMVDKKLKREVPPSVGSPDRGQITASGSNQFTEQDKVLMSEFGLDPNNKAHRTQWAISKKAASNG